MSTITSATNGSSTLSSTLFATVTALLAMTTPFVPPSDCPAVHDMTTFVYPTSTESGGWTTLTTQSLLVSNPENSNYTLCQPSGWESVVPSMRQSFSPAVCPSGWWYFQISTSQILSVTTHLSRSRTLTRTISTATCCMSGYDHYDYVVPRTIASTTVSFSGMNPGCQMVYYSRDVPISASLLNEPGSDIFSSGTAIHPAWHISWEASDVSTLSPQPPSLTPGMLIPRWAAGQEVRPADANRNERSASGRVADNFGYFLIFGFPVIIRFLLIGCCVCCYRQSKSKKRKAEAQRLAASEAALTEVPPLDAEQLPAYHLETIPPPKYT